MPTCPPPVPRSVSIQVCPLPPVSGIGSAHAFVALRDAAVALQAGQHGQIDQLQLPNLVAQAHRHRPGWRCCCATCHLQSINRSCASWYVQDRHCNVKKSRA